MRRPYHQGLDNQILANRIAVYENARQQHPKRWSKHVRKWTRTDTVYFNTKRANKKSG
jgi:hypothetical protein